MPMNRSLLTTLIAVLLVGSFTATGCRAQNKTTPEATPKAKATAPEVTKTAKTTTTDAKPAGKDETKPMVVKVIKPAPRPRPKPKPEDPELKAMSKKMAKLSAQRGLAQAELEAELADAKAEIQRINTQMQLDAARQKQQLAKVSSEKMELEAKMALVDTRTKAQLFEMTQKTNKLAAEAAVQAKLMSVSLSKKKLESQKIAAEIAYQQSLLDKSLAKMALENKRLTAEMGSMTTKLKYEQAKLLVAMAEQKKAMAQMDADIAFDAKRASYKTKIYKPVEYTKTPFKKGKLHISDRRIELNGPVTSGMADSICEQIHFYNNQSTEWPIFIVIDSSPGGSILAGAQILQAMEASKSPIHVVVKRFAASMAAVITTLAEESYIYPNAMFLHHQASSGNSGNITQQKENLDMIKEWEKRFGGPVAKKMGISIKEFTKRMYEKNSDGDWMEFGNNTTKLKWVNHIVTDLEEDDIRQKPEKLAIPSFFFFEHKQGESPFMKLQIDSQGQAFMKLPPINPYDAWYIYNPNRFYR